MKRKRNDFHLQIANTSICKFCENGKQEVESGKHLLHQGVEQDQDCIKYEEKFENHDNF